jgi:hypothetical protein
MYGMPLNVTEGSDTNPETAMNFSMDIARRYAL